MHMASLGSTVGSINRIRSPLNGDTVLCRQYKVTSNYKFFVNIIDLFTNM